MVANKDTVEVTQEVHIPFRLWTFLLKKSRLAFSKPKFDIILSHDTVMKAGRRNVTYRDCMPSTCIDAIYDPYQLDIKEDTDFSDILSHMDLSFVLKYLVSIIDSDRNFEFDAMNDLSEPYSEKISETACYDWPNV
jgi:hypothetical protein